MDWKAQLSIFLHFTKDLKSFKASVTYWDEVEHSGLIELYLGQAVCLSQLWRTQRWGTPKGRQVCILSNLIMMEVQSGGKKV